MSGPSGTHTHSHVLTVHRTIAPVRTHLILFTGGPCSGAYLSGQFRPPQIGQKWQVSRRGPPITDAFIDTGSFWHKDHPLCGGHF